MRQPGMTPDRSAWSEEVAVRYLRVHRPRISLERLEPAVPLFLGLHGLATICWRPTGSAAITSGFAAITLLGIAGLAGWCSTRAVLLRATACLALALAAQLREPDLVPAMLQWYYCVAAVYSLMLTGWRAALIGPLTGACYFAQVLFGSAPVPLTVAALRSGVLAALGLVMYLAGRAHRQARLDAEQGRTRAEAVGRQLAHTAAHDGLTDLPNRDRFLATAEDAMTFNGSSTFAAMVVDVDRFKSVNDALGHGSGDRMLVEVARRLGESALASPTSRDRGALCVARLGGDSFGVLLDAADPTRWPPPTGCCAPSRHRSWWTAGNWASPSRSASRAPGRTARPRPSCSGPPTSRSTRPRRTAGTASPCSTCPCRRAPTAR